MGAYWALWLAQQKPELIRSVTLFYGTNGGDGDFRQSKAAFLGNFAENDPYEPTDGIQALEMNLKSANRPTTFYTYGGTGHWFFEKDRQDAYRPQAARSSTTTSNRCPSRASGTRARPGRPADPARDQQGKTRQG